jgi:DNA replication protein DnaC
MAPPQLAASVLTVFTSDVKCLRKGIIKTSKIGGAEPYTILLFGGIGVGKSLFLKLIANVLIGKDIDHYDFDILDDTNGHGGSSRAKVARLYELRSKNGRVVSASPF